MKDFKTFKANAEKFRVESEDMFRITDFVIGDLVEYDSEHEIEGYPKTYYGVVIKIGASKEHFNEVGIKFINSPRRGICYFTWEQSDELQKMRIIRGKTSKGKCVGGF